jgi:hypothetical protein
LVSFQGTWVSREEKTTLQKANIQERWAGVSRLLAKARHDQIWTDLRGLGG